MKYGCIPSKLDLRDYKLDKKRVCAVAYPDEFSLQMKGIKNQKNVGSCVAHSVSEILEYHEKNAFNTLSTNFIYGIRNKLYGSTGEGMMLRDALRIAYSYGDMTVEDCPGNVEVDGVFNIANEAFADSDKLSDAYKYRIKQYTRLSSANDIKYALTNFGPVLISIKWYDDYTVDKNTGLIKFDQSSDYGYHALVIYGWNENGWMIQNSWGESWGKKGTFVYPFSNVIEEAFSVVDDETLDADSAILTPVKNDNRLLEAILKLFNTIANAFEKIFMKR